MSRMLFGWNSAKLSAQSPPCNKKAFPAATAARRCCKRRASPAKTRGGKRRRVSSTLASAASSEYPGTGRIGKPRQLSGDQFSLITQHLQVGGRSTIGDIGSGGP